MEVSECTTCTGIEMGNYYLIYLSRLAACLLMVSCHSQPGYFPVI